MLKQFWQRYYLTIVAGILIGTSYIPLPPWASFFAFVPLWIFLQKQTSWKSVFWGTFITGFVLTFLGFNWVAHTMKEFGHMPWPFAILALFGFCAFANLDLAAASLTWYFIKKRLNLSPLAALPLLAVLTALFERHFPTIFAWNYGFTFYWIGLPFVQIAELIGFQGISSLVILCNLLAYSIWQNRGTVKAKRNLVYFIGGFLILNGAGLVLRSSLPPADAKARVLITQANIGNQEKQYAENGSQFREKIIEKYVTLTRAALAQNAVLENSEPVSFVLWPETAIPADIVSSEAADYLLYPVTRMVRETETPLISGGYGQTDGTDKPTNGFFIFERSSKVQWPYYYKTVLLAFGEYMPFSDYYPPMKRWFPTGDFARGPGPQVKTLEGVTLGPQICYESLFPEFSRELVKQGAELILNVTNDSWFGEWQEPHQHLYMTLARAIEFRVPVIRSTNTGISTVALADGSVLEKSPMGREWAKIYDVPFKRQPQLTFYAKIPWLMDALLIILTGFLIWRGLIGTTQTKRD